MSHPRLDPWTVTVTKLEPNGMREYVAEFSNAHDALRYVDVCMSFYEIRKAEMKRLDRRSPPAA